MVKTRRGDNKTRRGARTSSCVLCLDFQGSSPFPIKGVPCLWEPPFPWPFHPCPHLPHHLTPHSKRRRGAPPPRGLPSGVLVLAPARGALPCSAAVTWLFSRSLSAAPASPPQSNDAIAAVSALAPGTCCHPRAGKRRLGSVANG